jgi:N-acetylglucosamine-6-phosphate deacetylase
MTTIITARRLVQRRLVLEHPIVTIDGGEILRIDSRDSAGIPLNLPADSSIRNYPDATIVPSYIDVHVHGAAGRDVMEATPEAMETVSRFLGSRGVGAFLPTTVTAPVNDTLRVLDQLADAVESPAAMGGATPIGIHLEGPFLAPTKRGVHPEELLEPPSIDLFDRFWQASRGHIRLMTIAPELENATGLIDYATARGVRCSLGHSNATALQAEAGYRAGARSATHTFNAMRALDQRDPGLAAYVLDNENLYAELICDGIHVDPIMVRLFSRMKGPEKAILITDGISATGMPDGENRLGDLQVEVHGGRCILAGPQGGALAGSVLTLDQAIRNFARFTGNDLSKTVPLATQNPACMLEIDGGYGVLEAGRRANLLALSPTGELLEVFLGGKPIS